MILLIGSFIYYEAMYFIADLIRCFYVNAEENESVLEFRLKDPLYYDELKIV